MTNLIQIEEMQKALLDNIPDCVALILKKNTREIVASNKFAIEIGAVSGETCFAKCSLRDTVCPWCLAPDLWKDNETRKVEIEYEGKWYEGVWAPLSDDLYVHYIFDITERKKLMEEEGRAAQLAALGTVAAGVAHEINNPINGIINYATLLKSKHDDHDKVVDLSQHIIKESDRIANITQELLFYSKNNRKEKKPTDLNNLISKTLFLLNAKIKTSNVLIKEDFSPALPFIEINPQSIQQVIINLLENSLYALERKEMSSPSDKNIVISAYLTNSEPSNCCIEVEDNGTGMSKEILSKAKGAFYSTKPSSEGTGLGLSIVNDILLKHKGDFEIDSEEGKYTKIKILLPLAENVQQTTKQ